MSASGGLLQWDADIVMTNAARQLHDAGHLTSPYDPAPIDLTILVSCFNEALYVIATLDSVRAAACETGLDFEIIVIDDGSSDNSRDLVRDYIARHPNERILLRANRVNKGLAQNYVDGAFLGVGKYYRLVCGDNAEPRETIATVLKCIGKADIIVPYYVSNEGRGLRRKLISKLYTGLINLITGNRLHYYNGLAVHLRHNVMRWHPNTQGFGFQAEILCMLIDLGFTVHQVPVAMVEQRRGQSNALTLRNMLSVAHTVSEIFIRRISHSLHSRRPGLRP
jgi:glycosyltransferase involved in cell wall biosynthesis